MATLTSDQMAEFKKMFDLFVSTTDCPEHIERGSFIRLVRALGMNPTDKDSQAMLAQCHLQEENYISFGEFCKIMEKWYKTVDEVKDELRQAFMKFDKHQDGWIGRDELRKVLMEIGKEAMTKEEVEEVMSMAIFNKDNRCDYEDLIKLLQEPQQSSCK